MHSETVRSPTQTACKILASNVNIANQTKQELVTLDVTYGNDFDAIYIQTAIT